MKLPAATKPIHDSRPDLFGHPLANRLPMASAVEKKMLVENMKQEGFDKSQPIKLLYNPETKRKEVLDGRNRTWAAIEAGVTPVFEDFLEAVDGDPAVYVLRRNLPRRNLDPSKRAIIAAEFYDYIRERRKALLAPAMAAAFPDLTPAPEVKKGEKTRDVVAKAVGASGRMVSSASKLAREAPDLHAQVDNGDISLSRAAELLKERKKEEAKEEKRKAEAAQRRELVKILEDRVDDVSFVNKVRNRTLLDETADLSLYVELPNRRREILIPLLAEGFTLKGALAMLDKRLDLREPIATLVKKAAALANAVPMEIPKGHLYHLETVDGAQVLVILKKPKR